MGEAEQNIQENPTPKIDSDQSAEPIDQTMDEIAFNFPLLGKLLGDGSIFIAKDKKNAIAEGGFAVMYRGRLRPVQLRWNQTIRGERDPIGFAVRDAEQDDDGKWTLTKEQLTIAEERRKKIEKEYAASDNPEAKELSFLKFHEPDFKELHSLEVAVKVLKPEARDDSGKLERFRREYHINREVLNHAHIVKCLELVIEYEETKKGNGEINVKEAYIVYEYVDGIELKELIGQVPISTVMDIMKQTLEAVVHAHDKGVIHRDYKPPNILLIPLKDETGNPVLDQFGNQKYFVKIIDYGIAKATFTTTDVELTQEKERLGTPPYMSPEQAAGEGKNLTKATDMFSIGSAFYQVLTGKFPYTIIDKTTIQVLADVEAGRPPEPIRRIKPEISPRIEDFLLGLMAVERTQRFKGQQALKEAKSILDERDFNTEQYRQKISTQSTRQIRRDLAAIAEDDYLGQGKQYAKLAEIVPRIEDVPRVLKSFPARIKKADELAANKDPGKASEGKKKLNSLLNRLDEAIDAHARKTKTRQYYLELAATCFEKALPSGILIDSLKAEKSEKEELADRYQKKAAAERFRIRQLIEREQKPAGLFKRVVGHPATWVASGLILALGFIGAWHGYKEWEQKNFFEDAQVSQQKAKKLFKEGYLEEAASEANISYDTYDLNLPKRYNVIFEKDIDELKGTIATALEDANKEKELFESLARVDGLIKTYGFHEAKSILEKAEKTLEDFKSTPYTQLKAKLGTYAETVKDHRDKIKDKEDDIDDLARCVKKLGEIRKDIKRVEDDLTLDNPKFFPKDDYEILRKKIGRYKIRLDYDIVRENVNPKEFDTTFLAYLELEKETYNKLLLDTAGKSARIINQKLKDISATVTYLSKDYSVDNGMAKTEEITDIISEIEKKLEVMGEFNVEIMMFSELSSSDLKEIKKKLKLSDADVEKLEKEYQTKIADLEKLQQKIPTKADLEEKLKTVQDGYAPIKKQVDEFDKLKKAAAAKDKKAAAELGIFYFNRNNYAKAEELMKIAEGEDSVRPYLTIFDLGRKIKDPKNLTYRVLEQGYSSDDLLGLKGIIKTYKERLLIDQAMVSALELVNARTIMTIDIEKLKEKHGELYHATEERSKLDETKPETEKRIKELDASIAELRRELFGKIDNTYNNVDLQLQKQKPMARPELITQLAKAYELVGNKKKADQYYSLIPNSK